MEILEAFLVFFYYNYMLFSSLWKLMTGWSLLSFQCSLDGTGNLWNGMSTYPTVIAPYAYARVCIS